MTNADWTVIEERLDELKRKISMIKYPMLDPVRDTIPKVDQMIVDSKSSLGKLCDLEPGIRSQLAQQMGQVCKAIDELLLNVFYQPCDPPVSEAEAFYNSVKVLCDLAHAPNR